MPSSCISTWDAREGHPLALVGDESVRWTSGVRWDGVVVERLALGDFAPPEFQAPDHCVIVPLAPIAVEFHEQGRFQRRNFAPGDVAIFPAGAPRRLRHGPQELLVVALSRAFVGNASQELGGAADAELAEKHCVRDPCVQHIVHALAAQAQSGIESGRLCGESLGQALAVHLLSLHGSMRRPHRPQRGGLAPHCLRRVTGYIHEHLAEDVRLAALAEVASSSPYRFAHNFKQATGVAPHQYVIRARLDCARRMLRETDQTIAAIACATGFGSPSRFASLFRRATGATPSAYRASVR